MKNTLLIKTIASLFMAIGFWSCTPLEKMAQNNTEYDDLYYTTADRKASAELSASNSTDVNTNKVNDNSDNPIMTFDNQNANVDYIDRYQDSRLYGGNSYGAETYYNPNYMSNANVPVVGYANPYANNAWGMNSWNSPWGMNSWNNPYRRSGFNMNMGFGFGSMMGMNSWNNPWAMNAWNNPYGMNAWNDPWGYNSFNTWNSPWGMNAWNSPWGWGGATRVIVLNNNNTRNTQVASAYYGPRYNSGSANVIASENGRIRVRQSRTSVPTNGGGEVGGRPTGTDGKPALNTGVTSQPRYGTTRSREASTTNNQENGVYIPNTRTQNNNVNSATPNTNTRTNQNYRSNTPTRGSSPTYRSTTPTQNSSPTYRSTTPTQNSSPTYRSTTPTQNSSPTYRSTTPSRSSSPSTSSPSRTRPR